MFIDIYTVDKQYDSDQLILYIFCLQLSLTIIFMGKTGIPYILIFGNYDCLLKFCRKILVVYYSSDVSSN